MPDREKVIRAVDSCFDYWLDNHRCLLPLELENVRQLKADALALLKEQEPRVMTLEEVKGMKRLVICAVEQRSKLVKNVFNAEYGGIVTLGNKNFLDFGLYGDKNRYRRTEEGYGKTWRCWTSRPTDEQREAVKWE